MSFSQFFLYQFVTGSASTRKGTILHQKDVILRFFNFSSFFYWEIRKTNGEDQLTSQNRFPYPKSAGTALEAAFLFIRYSQTFKTRPALFMRNGSEIFTRTDNYLRNIPQNTTHLFNNQDER